MCRQIYKATLADKRFEYRTTFPCVFTHNVHYCASLRPEQCDTQYF